ncbi:MAG: prepilin peptidase [Bacteroidetes bacterium]|nr:prepilin peptidase [Bacteroidota bacterium]
MLWLCWIVLVLSGTGIIYQDLKTRLISLWLILIFAAANILQYLLLYSCYQLLENTIFCTCYFLFTFLVLVLFYYLKNKRFEKIMDSKLGWGDVFVFMAIGVCIEPAHLIFFFTGSFIISIIIYFFFLRSKVFIPLAGLIIPCYLLYVVFEHICRFSS